MYVWKIENISEIINKKLVIIDPTEEEENIKGIQILDESEDSEIISKLLAQEDGIQLSIFRKEYELFKKSVIINKVKVEGMMTDLSIYFTENMQNCLDDISIQLSELSNQELECERGIEIFSRLYLKMVESAFSKIMAINCFLIETINKGQPKKITEYLDMGIASMENIISSQVNNDCHLLLYGYNRIIRNSIAHCKMNTRQFGKKIVFIDEYKGRQKTIVLEHVEFRELVYLLYINIITQITANKYYWQSMLERSALVTLPILDVQTYLTCIRDELYGQYNNINKIIKQNEFANVPKFDVFKIEYDRYNSLIISIRIDCYCERLLQILLKVTTYTIARICRYFEKSINFKLTHIKTYIFDIDDSLIMTGGCEIVDIESPIETS
ncbi:hypothetical protein [Clostridium sp. DJ247]|uniref:hypothetical protein n=1 Tax=Clostridium sp. DJ247 TaxID=2726188 RepID=UPI0016284688|nr:hypothetical protein [Clostridium sp. DJ247]MBC2579169.1 hypothetical protein [Clostridium sp. DJ247]